MRMAKQHVEVFKCEAQITKDVYFLRSVDISSFRLLKRIKGEDGKAMQEMCLQLVLFGLFTSCRQNISLNIHCYISTVIANALG